jgi:hypothetical protein
MNEWEVMQNQIARVDLDWYGKAMA